MAKKAGQPKLVWDDVYARIKKGKIKTEQPGRSAIWVVTEPYHPLKIERWTILVPNVTSGVVMSLSELKPLIRQQDHILNDGYSRGELPELRDIFQTLLYLVHVYGTMARLSPKIRKKIATELRSLIARIEETPVVKKATRLSILEALLRVAKEVEKGAIRGAVANAIEAVFDRLNQLGVIMPAIDHRRKDAFEALCQLERELWLFAYKISTVRKVFRERNARSGLLNYVREAELPIFQPYRLHVTNAKRILCLAIGALDNKHWDTAEKLINLAIQRLGFSSIDLVPVKSID